jgi:hypothetical protein
VAGGAEFCADAEPRPEAIVAAAASNEPCRNFRLAIISFPSGKAVDFVRTKVMSHMSADLSIGSY